MEDNSQQSDLEEDSEILYKMIDGQRVPCTPEETAEIKAGWAAAAAEAQRQQEIDDLRAQDALSNKTQTLMYAVNHLIKGQPVPSEMASQIEQSCLLADQINVLMNQ